MAGPPHLPEGEHVRLDSGIKEGDLEDAVGDGPGLADELVQAAVVAQRMRDGQIESLSVPRNPLDVLAQQIVAMTAMDDWAVGDLERVVRRAAPFSRPDPAGARRGA